MHGQIEVESSLGKGSLFRLSFPGVQVSVDAAVSVPVEGRLEDLPPMKIVAVDDVPLNRELLKRFFEQTPHRLLLASSGAEGVALVAAERPELVLMDIRMPGMDGREALRHIRANPALHDVVVVAVTASSLLDEEHTLRSLFDGYVRKPITRQSLCAELARLFGQDAVREGEQRDSPAAPAAEQATGFSEWSSERRSALQLLIDGLQDSLQRAMATQASNDVAAVVEQARQVAQLLDAPQWQQLAAQIEAAALLFDLDGLGQRLDALALRIAALQQSLAESRA
jgi:CheY-like chemotaxis protein